MKNYKRRPLLYETTPAVDAIARLNLSGDIIPHSWNKRIRTDEGRPYPKAVLILANIVYWHRPVEVLDEITGDLVGYRRKFSGPKFQLRAKMYDNLFGFSKRETGAAVNRLAELGLIEKDLIKSIIINGTHYGNVLYVTPLAKAIEVITYDEDDEKDTEIDATSDAQTPPLIVTGPPTTVQSQGGIESPHLLPYGSRLAPYSSNLLPHRSTYSEISSETSSKTSTDDDDARAERADRLRGFLGSWLNISDAGVLDELSTGLSLYSTYDFAERRIREIAEADAADAVQRDKTKRGTPIRSVMGLTITHLRDEIRGIVEMVQQGEATA